MSEQVLKFKPKTKEAKEDPQAVLEKEYKQMVAFLDETAIDALYKTRDKAVAEGNLDYFLEVLDDIDQMIISIIADEYIDPSWSKDEQVSAFAQIFKTIEGISDGQSTQESGDGWEKRTALEIY